MMPKQALAGTYTTPLHVHALTNGNRFLDNNGDEVVVYATKRLWLAGVYVGDVINESMGFMPNESVRLVVGGSTGASIC